MLMLSSSSVWRRCMLPFFPVVVSGSSCINSQSSLSPRFAKSSEAAVVGSC